MIVSPLVPKKKTIYGQRSHLVMSDQKLPYKISSQTVISEKKKTMFNFDKYVNDVGPKSNNDLDIEYIHLLI